MEEQREIELLKQIKQLEEQKQHLRHESEERLKRLNYADVEKRNLISSREQIKKERDEAAARLGELKAAVRMACLRGDFAKASISDIEEWIKRWDLKWQN